MQASHTMSSSLPDRLDWVSFWVYHSHVETEFRISISGSGLLGPAITAAARASMLSQAGLRSQVALAHRMLICAAVNPSEVGSVC